MPVEMTFGEILNLIRCTRGLSRAQLAKEMGVHVSSFRRWERDEADIPLSRAIWLNRRLQMNMHIHSGDDRCQNDIDLVFRQNKKAR